MEESLRKVPKMRLLAYAGVAVKRGRVHRFAKWCAKKYNISWRGIYESFRGSNTSDWKWEGMHACVQEYDPRYKRYSKKFWEECKKNMFAEFMSTKGMSRGTLWKRVSADSWNALELKGIKATYNWWLENVELKKTRQ